MKGIMIFESPFMGSHYVRAVEVKETDYTFETSITEDATGTLSGYFSKSSQAKCSKKDTYDFETGALIALMKMCGFDKSYTAIEEAFKYNSYDAKKSKELNIPKREFDKIHDLDVKEYYSKLSEENINLKKEKEQIIVAKNILYNNLEKENEKLKKRINELESYNAKLEERIAGEQRGGYKLLKDMEKLQHDYDLCKNSERALKCSVDYLNKTIAKLNISIDGYKEDLNKATKRCEELEIKESILNKQEETIKKREEMWDKIFALHKESDVIIKVKKEDINTFLHELENKIPEITWYSCVKIFETKYTIGDIYEELKTCDAIYFRLHKRNKLSYTSDSHIYPYRELKPIDYLPPMRWDLFKKGRKIVRVTPENIDDFIVKCTNKFGSIMKPVLKRYKDFTHIFVMISDYHYDNKPTIHIMTPEDLVRNQHENPKKYSDKKIVDWEDVR